MKIFVWTHHDLDGVISYITLKWAHPNDEFSYQTTNAWAFREDYLKWSLKNKLEDYDKVFIVDLDVSESVDLIDKKNVTLIDHHNSHVENGFYNNATAHIENGTSACMAIYQLYKDKVEFTKAQKLLIILGNDYDSYTLEVPYSKMLNSIFWKTQNNFETFIEKYKDGFIDFTTQQINLYEQHQQELKNAIEKLEYYENRKAKIDGKFYHVISTFSNKFVNDVADHILENYDPDIAIVVNPTTKHVSFRRSESSNIDVGTFASVIAKGGGHPYAGGGTITDEFLAFTKTLKRRLRLRKLTDE